MRRLDIRIYDDPILREKAQPIATIEPRHRQLAEDMAETMYDANGIGLAANQIGLAERIIVVDVEWSRSDKSGPRRPVTMINPQILDEATEDEDYEEGCLSLPEIEGDVWRPVSITYKYQNLDGQVIEAEADGLLARCIQHEIDHLDGILFIDHLAPQQRERLAGKLYRLRKRRAETAQA